MQNQRKNSIRWRKSLASASHSKKAKTANRNQTNKTKNQKKKALNTLEINSFLKTSESFLGTFSCDQLPNLVINSFPSFLVVNTAPINKNFGHWIAIRIARKSLEIFDSLGGDPKKWGSRSLDLLNFLQFYSRRKLVFVSPVLQNCFSQLCGYYAVYFILARKYLSLSEIISPFSTDLKLNDKIICDLLLTVV